MHYHCYAAFVQTHNRNLTVALFLFLGQCGCFFISVLKLYETWQQMETRRYRQRIRQIKPNIYKYTNHHVKKIQSISVCILWRLKQSLVFLCVFGTPKLHKNLLYANKTLEVDISLESRVLLQVLQIMSLEAGWIKALPHLLSLVSDVGITGWIFNSERPVLANWLF